jgi:hypothetical protein
MLSDACADKHRSANGLVREFALVLRTKSYPEIGVSQVGAAGIAQTLQMRLESAPAGWGEKVVYQTGRVAPTILFDERGGKSYRATPSAGSGHTVTV